MSTANTISPTLLATMNGTPSTNTSSSNLSAAGALAGNTSATALQNNFMTLLVTQMQNQDPLNPMDNSQVTSQMADRKSVV